MAEVGPKEVDNAIQLIQTAGRALKNVEPTQLTITTLNTLTQTVQQDPTFRCFH